MFIIYNFNFILISSICLFIYVYCLMFNFQIKDILYSLSGLLICIFFLYIRIFKERVAIEIDFTWNIYKFSLYLILFFLFFYLIVKNLYKKESQNKIIIWIKQNIFYRLINMYENSLNILYDRFIETEKIPYIWGLLYQSFSFIEKYFFFKKELYNVIFYYSIIVLPRILIVCCFFLDVIIFQKFYYLYKIIWILIIPFFFRIFYFLSNKYYEKFMIFFNNYYDYELIKDKNNKLIQISLTRKSSNYVNCFPLPENVYNQMEIDIIRFYYINELWIKMYSPIGPIAIAPYFKLITIFIQILYLSIWGFFIIKMIF